MNGVHVTPLIDLWRSQAVVMLRNGVTISELRTALADAEAKAKCA
jgi:hypothetical protein